MCVVSTCRSWEEILSCGDLQRTLMRDLDRLLVKLESEERSDSIIFNVLDPDPENSLLELEV